MEDKFIHSGEIEKYIKIGKTKKTYIKNSLFKTFRRATKERVAKH